MAAQGGQFNYALKKTGFLSEAKMRARRISQNPKKFLDTYAEKSVEIVPLECEALDCFIDNLKNAGRYDGKQVEMIRRQELAKKRSFLLNLATSPSISAKVGVDIDYLKDSEESRNAQKVDCMIETFLSQIKTTDLTTTETWLSTSTSMKDVNLPYGLPKELKLPLFPSDVKKRRDTDDVLIEFIESTHDDFLLLDGEYHTKLEEITKNLEHNFDLIVKDNWSLKNLSLLSYVLSSVEESRGPSAVALLSELTSRLFPDKSKEDIIAQKYRLKTKRCLEQKQALAIRDWVKDKDELQEKVNKALEDMSKQHVLKMEHMLSRKRQESICLHWTKQLDKLRKEKCEQVRRLQIIVEPLEKRKAERIRLQQDNEIYRRAIIKLEVKKREEKKVMEKINEIRKQETVSNMLREIEKIQAKQNRVDYRAERLQSRTKTRKETEIAMEQDRQLRKAILESTKEHVEINYEPSNILTDTHATAVRRFETLKNSNVDEDAMITFFRERYSFSAETILKDRRNRVEAKLREVGLLESSYARQILLAMEPKPKPHLESQIKFQHDQ